MNREMMIYICDSDVDAQAARDFLLKAGYSDAEIESTTGPVAAITYDAQTYRRRTGPLDQQENAWVVIGRR